MKKSDIELKLKQDFVSVHSNKPLSFEKISNKINYDKIFAGLDAKNIHFVNKTSLLRKPLFLSLAGAAACCAVAVAIILPVALNMNSPLSANDNGIAVNNTFNYEAAKEHGAYAHFNDVKEAKSNYVPEMSDSDSIYTLPVSVGHDEEKNNYQFLSYSINGYELGVIENFGTDDYKVSYDNGNVVYSEKIHVNITFSELMYNKDTGRLLDDTFDLRLVYSNYYEYMRPVDQVYPLNANEEEDVFVNTVKVKYTIDENSKAISLTAVN